MQFEHVHVKTTKEGKEINNSRVKFIVLKCDKKTKEESIKCEDQHKNERISFVGHVTLKFKNRWHGRIVSKLIKTVDSTIKFRATYAEKCG